MHRMIAAVLTVVLVALNGAGLMAASKVTRVQDADQMRAFVERLPPGAALKVRLTDGRTIKGTLMAADPDVLVLQPKTRVPEPPIEVPYDRIAAVEPVDQGIGAGKAVLIGVAAGAAAFFGLLLFLFAVVSD